jgi:hypothetical protein
MNEIWLLNIDEYLDVIKIGQELGLKAGDDLTPIFKSYMELKGKQPIGKTELNREELIKEYLSHNKKILNVETNEGKTTFNIIKEV